MDPVASTFLQEFNTFLNAAGLIVVLLVALYFGPRAWKANEAKAREQEMQRTITAYKEHVEVLEPEVEKLRSEVKEFQALATKWEARYVEQSKYTAPEALASVLVELQQTRKVFETSMESLGVIMVEHSRLVAGALNNMEKRTGGPQTAH